MDSPPSGIKVLVQLSGRVRVNPNIGLTVDCWSSHLGKKLLEFNCEWLILASIIEMKNDGYIEV
jgi:hypothetical protein